MKRKVFISFRFNDGNLIREEIINKLVSNDIIIDKSEDIDRSDMSDDTIQYYLYEKLRDTSITIVLLTPLAVNYSRDFKNNVDDWLYDELRYSLLDRKGNTNNGVIAIYTDEAKKYLFNVTNHKCNNCDGYTIKSFKNFDNLVRPNIMNVKNKFKKNQCSEVYNLIDDGYIIFVHINDFISNPSHYINKAIEHRDIPDNYNIVKQL